jgi:hypothetical protein
MTQGEALKGFTKIVHKFCQANEANEAVAITTRCR